MESAATSSPDSVDQSTASDLSPTTTAAATGSTNAHRSKLLFKLGIENATVPILPSNREQPSRRRQVQTTTEPLKDDATYDQRLQQRQARALQKAAVSTGGNRVLLALGSFFMTSQQQQQQQQRQQQEQKEVTVEADAERDDAASLTSSDGSSASDDDDSSISSASTTSEAAPSINISRHITFNEQVTVVPIPRREQYSKRIRSHLWVNAKELQSQAARNTAEFAAEGWDWKNVLEDEYMYVCAVTGEKVHPVHCEEQD